MAKPKHMILCDTNILIEFYKNNANVTKELKRIGQSKIAISAITRAELYFGAINKMELRKIKQHLSLIHVISLDSKISENFIELMEDYSLSHKLAIPDALIAATALAHQIELYTLNIRDFHFISGLSLYQSTNLMG